MARAHDLDAPRSAQKGVSAAKRLPLEIWSPWFLRFGMPVMLLTVTLPAMDGPSQVLPYISLAFVYLVGIPRVPLMWRPVIRVDEQAIEVRGSWRNRAPILRNDIISLERRDLNIVALETRHGRVMIPNDLIDAQDRIRLARVLAAYSIVDVFE